jgi:hypothetical protein
MDFSEHSLFSEEFHSAYESDSETAAMSMRVAFNSVRTTIVAGMHAFIP